MSVASGRKSSMLAEERFTPILEKQFFTISLAEWSLHRSLFSDKINNLDFPGIAARDYNIYTVEYVNQFFNDKAEDTVYLNDLLRRCNDNNVKNHLIMIDNEGGLAELDDKVRMQAVENHYKWVDAAKFLGCETIRVNAYGIGNAEDVKSAAVNGLSKLAEYAAKAGINIIVENHGGYSSNGEWLCGVMKQINMKNVGTLPDFGNFCLKYDNCKCIEEYDRYKGVEQMMPYAKGASAKTIDFDDTGNCIETDYNKMLTIIKDSGFSGYIGIEFGGEKFNENEGILKTKALLQKAAAEINYPIQ